MDTLIKRILERVDDLIADGPWETAVTVISMDEQQAITKGIIWLFRPRSDVIEGRIVYEITDEDAEFTLWTTRLVDEPFREAAALFTARARFSAGDSLHNLMQQLEAALDNFPKEGDIVE
jgi:hypothetical protein